MKLARTSSPYRQGSQGVWQIAGYPLQLSRSVNGMWRLHLRPICISPDAQREVYAWMLRNGFHKGDKGLSVGFPTRSQLLDAITQALLADPLSDDVRMMNTDGGGR